MSKVELNQKLIATVAGNVTVFNYDGGSREYLSSSIEYLCAGVGIPANSCIDAPGESKSGFAICRTTDLTSWEYISDHRGRTVYNTETMQQVQVTTLGDCPECMTFTAPTSPYDKWDGEKWVTDVVAKKAGDISDAELKRQTLLSDANNVTADWRTELALGIISDSDKEKLIAWMEYIKAVKAIDTSTAPDIKWPIVPNQ